LLQQPPAVAARLVDQRHRGILLLGHIPEIRRHPAVVELVDEISDAIHQARRAVDRPADRVYLGQCMETPDEEGRPVTCLEDIYARPWATCWPSSGTTLRNPLGGNYGESVDNDSQ
jgi:hypothetical protein